MTAHSTTFSENDSGNKSKVMHWSMVIVAMLCLLISNGMTLTAITAFDSAILAEFTDWSRGDLKMRGLITLVITGLFAPFIGIIIDKFGVRILMMIGAVILAASTYSYGFVTNIKHIYYIHMAFGVVLLSCGLNIAVILVSNWFVKLRGTAIGIAVMGTSLGGAILAPMFGGWMADGMSWRDAFQLSACIPVILFILAIVLVKNKPSDVGLSPFGLEPSEDKTNCVSDQGLTYNEAIRTKSFWSIALIAMFTFYCLLGLQANLVLHLQDLGFDIQSAAAGLTMLFTPALIGKFVFGLVADKVKNKAVLYGNLSLMLAGLIALYFSGQTSVLISIAVIGFAWGGFYTLFQLNAIECFGLKASGKLLGTITVLDAFGGGLGIFVTGKLFDVYGSYQMAFLIFIVLVVISLGLISQIKKHA